jgi:hypothetical protein
MLHLTAEYWGLQYNNKGTVNTRKINFSEIKWKALAYIISRDLENTSMEGFLRSKLKSNTGTGMQK